MELNQIDIHYLIAAICVISSALVFYTIGVWGERLQRKLKFWHLIFFLLGLLADTVGTSLMEHIAELTHLHDEMHTVTGDQERVCPPGTAGADGRACADDGIDRRL